MATSDTPAPPNFHEEYMRELNSSFRVRESKANTLDDNLPSQSYLLDLPLEYRLEIYKYVFSDIRIEACIIPYSENWSYRIFTANGERIFPACFLVNKQFYAESMPVFYQEVELSINLWGSNEHVASLSEPEALVNVLPRLCRCHIFHVSIRESPVVLRYLVGLMPCVKRLVLPTAYLSEDYREWMLEMNRTAKAAKIFPELDDVRKNTAWADQHPSLDIRGDIEVILRHQGSSSSFGEWLSFEFSYPDRRVVGYSGCKISE